MADGCVDANNNNRGDREDDMHNRNSEHCYLKHLLSLCFNLYVCSFHFRTLPLPNVDRSTKPASLLSPSIHSKVGLRDVIVPSRLMGKFMNLAQRNTNQNIETCGILAGTLVSVIINV